MAVNDLITFRKGTASEWTLANPVLASGEPGYDLTNSILKIGDGVSNWASLSGIGSTSFNNSSPSVGVRGIISTTGTLSSFAVSGGYPVGYLDLFQDGVKLVSDLDFSATDGSNVTLSNSVPSGTILEYLTLASGVSTGGGSLSGTVTIPESGEQYWSSVSLLLNGEGILADSSSFANAITIYGNAGVSTAQKKWGTGSIVSDGNGDYLTLPQSAFNFQDGDFVVEWWQYIDAETLNSGNGNQQALWGNGRRAGVAEGMCCYIQPTAFNNANCIVIDAYIGGSWTSPFLAASATFTGSLWQHCAIVRSGTTYSLYLDGVRRATTTSSSSPQWPNTASASILSTAGSAGEFVSSGKAVWIDDFRITIGSNRSYTGSTITVPITTHLTGAYTAQQTLPVTITGSSGGSSGGGLSWSSVPASSSASGTTGQIAYDSNYFYIATNTNTWKRSSLASWPLVSMNYLLVAGGGGGGNGRGGGGGAGGYVYSATSVPVGESISVTVGGGGAGSANSVVAQNGSNSSITLPSETIVAVGGGGGADGLKGLFTGSGMAGASGGSGGGGSGYNPVGSGGSGTVDQGYAGGAGYGGGEPYGGGGGGGAGGAGGSGQIANGGSGKTDTMLAIVSAGVDVGGTRYIAGGGGAGSYNYTPGSGGSGGGGDGGNTNTNGNNAVANTGGGGGGGGNSANGGSGGSGIVILRCPDSFTATTTGSPSTYVTGGYRYYKFTQNGTITFSVV